MSIITQNRYFNFLTKAHFAILLNALSSRILGKENFEGFPKMTVFGEMINWGKSFG